MAISKKTILIALTASFMVAGGLFVYFTVTGQEQRASAGDENFTGTEQDQSPSDGEQNRPWGVGLGHPEGEAPGAGGAHPDEDDVSVAEPLYVFDVADERKLVGDADNVFLGRVAEEIGTFEVPSARSPGAPEPQEPEAPTMPRTEFSVEILQNVKGSLSGTVTVSQSGGWVEYAAQGRYLEDGVEPGDRVRELSLADGDPLLQPGDIYLFVTGHNERGGYHQITAPGYGNVPANSPQKRANLIERFTEARISQIDPFEDNPRIE